MISYTLLEFDDLSSTSNFLKENQTYFPNMTIIRANHQSEGRGQFDRKWESEKGENLLFSILLKHVDVKKTYDIRRWITSTLLLFLQQKNIEVTFKEPNDIYYHDQKLCGILIETKASAHLFDYVIIGVGMNINQQNFINSRATSLNLILNEKINIKHLFDELIGLLMESYEQIVL